MDQKRKMKRKYIRLKTTLVFIFIFLAVWCVIWIINQSQERREKLKATYTAESTVSRVESQLSKYLAESDLMKRIVEKEYDIDNEQFDKLAELMQEDEDVIEARELAEDGVVSRIYPMEGNEAAMGLDMLQNPARKKEARLARLSGEYTIAGPYELVQGGTGALLFDPAYITDQNGEEKFWGFSILVMNWDNFIQEVELEKLEEAGYDYQIWKKDLYTGEKIVIDESENSNLNNSLEVACSVPNDTWYFEIVPENGWITVSQKVFGVIISIALAVMASVGYWQYKMRRYKDILHEEELEKAAIEARMANEAKTRFLFYMSHDIRTPMNAIIGMTTLGLLKLDDPADIKNCLSKIDTSSRYLLSLINDILDMSKIETGKMEIVNEKFDIQMFFEDLVAIIYPQAEDLGIRLEIHHEEPMERYYLGDALRTKQILLNLLSNALKFTPEGGNITVTVKEQRKAGGYAYLKFRVSDTGSGISEKFMPKIFQPFEQESPEGARNNVGSGLGLSIVYNLVQMMGGTIEVKSKKGEGTSFLITLPFGLISDDEEALRERRAKELLSDMKILIADDDVSVGQEAAGILSGMGAESKWVETGIQAVEEVKKALETGKHFNIALIDWKMPDIDGIETTRRIRRLVGTETMIIIISAYDWSRIEEQAREAGADHFISKPLFSSTLCRVFTELCDSAPERERKVSEPGALCGKRVLVAEDNAINREVVKSLLEAYGILAETAENGKICVEMLQAAPDGYYLAVLMDIRMPVMNGLEAVKAIRDLGTKGAEEIPVLAMTANAFEEDKAAAYAAGMTGYLVKPLDIRILIKELEKLTDK